MRRLTTILLIGAAVIAHLVASGICAYHEAACSTEMGIYLSLTLKADSHEGRMAVIRESGARIPEDVRYSAGEDGNYVLTSPPFRQGPLFSKFVVRATQESKMETIPLE